MIIFTHTHTTTSFTYHVYHLTPTPKTVIQWVNMYKMFVEAWGFYKWLLLLVYPKGH